MNVNPIPNNKREVVRVEVVNVEPIKHPEITAYERRLNEQRTPRLD